MGEQLGMSSTQAATKALREALSNRLAMPI
jgi:hypothetical protein